MKPLQRPYLLWFGRAPRPEHECEIAGRKMKLQVVTSQQPQLRYARAAVFWAADTEFDATLDALEGHLVACINEGLLTYVVVSDDVAQVTHMTEAIDALVPKHASSRNVIVRNDAVSPQELANEALLHDPGPVANHALTFEGDISSLTPQRKLLLQRAFSDSPVLKLTPIKAGFSGASTFIVHATVNASPPLPEPMPFFVKLGDSAKLLDELTRFRKHAEHYITWNLRPNFLMERSIYGVFEGVLVGTFVEGSRSLAECAQAGGGEKYIATLFYEGGASALTGTGATTQWSQPWRLMTATPASRGSEWSRRNSSSVGKFCGPPLCGAASSARRVRVGKSASCTATCMGTTSVYAKTTQSSSTSLRPTRDRLVQTRPASRFGSRSRLKDWP